MSKIENTITEYRKINGWTKTHLAMLLGVSSTAVGKWEAGTSNPKPVHCKKMAELFDISVELLSKSGSALSLTFGRFPFYSEVEVAAGNGIRVDKERIEGYVSIPISDLKLASSKKNIVCINAAGDSMEPVFYDRSILAVDLGAFSIVDGKIYVIRQSGMLRVKVLYLLPEGIRVHSFNPKYTDEIYLKDDVSNVNVVGRVLWYGVGLV